MSVRDYITRFEDITHRCDVREHRFLTIIKFISCLRSDIRRAMITSSYDVDSVEDVFDFALKINLTFKRIVSAIAWKQCSKLEIWTLWLPTPLDESTC